MTVGLDTGFFVRLLEEDPTAAEVWELIRRGEAEAVVSCLTLYEIDRLGLRGTIETGSAETLVRSLPHVCRVLWLDTARLRRAARVGHGNGLAMADSLILVSLMDGDADPIYTTDSDLAAFPSGPEIVAL